MSNYLIAGEKGIGKSIHVKNMVLKEVCVKSIGCGVCDRCMSILNSNHPDYHYLDGGKIEEVKELLLKISEVPYYKRHIVVLDNMHDMAPNVQNTLLKPIEDSNGKVMFILVTRNISRIIPTIRSRVVINILTPMKVEEIVKILKTFTEEETLIKKAARFSQGNIGSAIEYVNRKDFYEVLSDDLKNIKDKNFFEMAQRYSKDFKDDIELVTEYYQKYLFEMIKKQPQNVHYMKAFEMLLTLKERMIQNVNITMTFQNIVMEIQKA